MKVDLLVKKIKQSGINHYGAVVIFGSFIKTDGEEYNDIDLYIETDPKHTNVIQNKLSKIGLKGRYNQIYYSNNVPTFPSPWKNDDDKEENDTEETSNLLHVTIATKEQVSNQPFITTMYTGKHIKIKKAA
jgi:hypothetical protein